MSIISITPERTRPIIVRGDTYYPADWDECIIDNPTDNVWHYVICVRDGDTPDADGSVPLYELSAPPVIDWCKPVSVQPIFDPDPRCYEIFEPYYDEECTSPADTAIIIDGAEYVFCVLCESECPSIDDGVLHITSYALRGADKSTVYAVTWQGPIDYDKADVRLYHDCALID